LQLTAARTEHEQTALQRQIDTTDRQIDGLLYELGVYPAEPHRRAGDGGRLMEEEVRPIEGDADKQLL